MEATRVFMDEVTKVAKIFGETPSLAIGSTHSGISEPVRADLLKSYAKKKAKEEPSSLPLALATGGTLGALGGGGLGLALGGPLGGLVGTGVGAGAGMLMGAGIQKRDKVNIEIAKKMLEDPTEFKRELGERMAKAETGKTLALSPTRAMLYHHILSEMEKEK